MNLETAVTNNTATLEKIQAAISLIVPPSVEVIDNDIVDILAAYNAKDPAQLPADEKNAYARAELASERASIWAKHLARYAKRHSLYDLVSLAEKRSSDISRISAKTATGPIKVQAANSLGTLSGSLIAQQSLSLLKADLPALNVFSNDFSNTAAKLNQQILSRVRTVPSVQSYSTSAGYVKSDVTDVDVPLTISAHRYVQFDYNANELASTSRNLFGEQAEGAIYGLAKDVVDSVLALVTVGNFSTSGGASVVAIGSFNRASVIAQRVALRKRKVPTKGTVAILNEDYFGALSVDPTIVSLATFQKPEIITDYVLPNVGGFRVVGYVDLPTTGNLAGYFATKEALVIATRLPYDYVDAQLGSNYGAVSQVTDPDTGLSIMLTQYVNHDAGASRFRVALMSGVAVGDIKRAQLITSA